MTRKSILFAAAFLAATPLISFAEDTDVAKDSVDPYNAGGERSRFLAAAGVDSELSEEEFKKNLDASDPFVRKFDNWTTLRGFDGNRNGTIDWFEADGYRKALRDAVMLAYDKNKDGSLTEGEREAALKDLTAGKAPRVNLPRRDRPATGGTPDSATPGTPGQPGNNNGQPDRGRGNRGPTDEQRAEFLKKYDKDGNGELSQEERDAGRAAQIEEWRKANPEEAARFDERRAADQKRRDEFTKKYDKDGNGELNDEERRAGFTAEREARMEEFKKENPEAYARMEKARADFTKRFDKDGNGELSDEERRTGFETMREEGRETFRKLTEKYDENGDGRLNREEWEKVPADERPTFGGLEGRGGRGGPGDRGQGGPGGRGGQGGNQPAPRGNGDL